MKLSESQQRLLEKVAGTRTGSCETYGASEFRTALALAKHGLASAQWIGMRAGRVAITQKGRDFLAGDVKTSEWSTCQRGHRVLLGRVCAECPHPYEQGSDPRTGGQPK